MDEDSGSFEQLETLCNKPGKLLHKQDITI